MQLGGSLKKLFLVMTDSTERKTNFEKLFIKLYKTHLLLALTLNGVIFTHQTSVSQMGFQGTPGFIEDPPGIPQDF